MKNYKFSDKTPLELTEEETLELEYQIAQIEFTRRADIQRICTSEDIAHDVLCYAYDKSLRGKVGINEIKQKPMNHYINILHLETRNSISYIIRSGKTQRFLYNTIPLNDSLSEEDNYKSVENTYKDMRFIDKIDDNIDLKQILSQIDNTEDENIIIKYGVGHENYISNFSYREFTKLYLGLFNGKQVRYSDFKGLLYNKQTNTELEDKEIKNLIKRFKTYLKKKDILGGSLECI